MRTFAVSVPGEIALVGEFGPILAILSSDDGGQKWGVRAWNNGTKFVENVSQDAASAIFQYSQICTAYRLAVRVA